MDRDTAALRIADGLGFRTDLLSRIYLRMQEAQRNLERGKTLPWFLIEEDVVLSLAADGTDIAFPEGFLRELDNEPVVWVDTSVTPNTLNKIRKVTLLQGFDAYNGRASGAPQVYTIRKDKFTFFPRADQAYSVIMSYYKSATSLESNVDDNAWLVNAPEVLIGDAGYRMASDLRNPEAKTLFAEMRSAAWDAIFRETIAREEANNRQAVGMGY